MAGPIGQGDDLQQLSWIVLADSGETNDSSSGGVGVGGDASGGGASGGVGVGASAGSDGVGTGIGADASVGGLGAAPMPG